MHGLTGRDRKTLMGWIDDGRYPNAVQDLDGRKTWRIPVSDLVANGDLDRAQVAEVAVTLEGLRESATVAGLRERIGELEAALRVAEALAEERRDMVKLLQTLLRGGTGNGDRS